MNLAEYVRARDALLERPYDYKAMAALMRSIGSEPPPPELAEVVYHKARAASAGVSAVNRLASAKWLHDRGYRSLSS